MLKPVKMRKKRMLKIADLLDTLPPRRIDMYTWCDGDFDVNDCSTVACVAGWSATVPSFRRAGLGFSSHPQIRNRKIVSFRPRPHARRVVKGYRAMAMFLGISTMQSEYLFDPTSYVHLSKFGATIPPKMVAQRIRKMVADHG